MRTNLLPLMVHLPSGCWIKVINAGENADRYIRVLSRSAGMEKSRMRLTKHVAGTTPSLYYLLINLICLLHHTTATASFIFLHSMICHSKKCHRPRTSPRHKSMSLNMFCCREGPRPPRLCPCGSGICYVRCHAEKHERDPDVPLPEVKPDSW